MASGVGQASVTGQGVNGRGADLMALGRLTPVTTPVAKPRGFVPGRAISSPGHPNASAGQHVGGEGINGTQAMGPPLAHRAPPGWSIRKQPRVCRAVAGYP